MPIYRCNKCGFVSEDSLMTANTKSPCARCGTSCTVYGTVYFVEELAKRLMATTHELRSLKQAENSGATPASPSDSKALTNDDQHLPLQRWFAERQIDAQFEPANVDTSGFFDDAAVRLGSEHEQFGELIERVCFAYRKSHSWVNLDLSKLPQKEAQAINALCRQLYEHTFFARYHYQKPEKIVRLTLQTAPAIRQFFEGGWLEWYVLTAALEHLDGGFSSARGVKVRFPDEDLHELDVVCLPPGKAPIFIECKSGEFRRDIDKYLRLRKRFDVDRSRFLLCAVDLTLEQAAGLNAMYELNFVNLETIHTHLQKLA